MQILPAEFCRSAQADIIDEVPKTTANHPKPQWDPPPSYLQMPNEFGVEGLHCFGLAIHASHQTELKLAVAAGWLRAGVAASKCQDVLGRLSLRWQPVCIGCHPLLVKESMLMCPRASLPQPLPLAQMNADNMHKIHETAGHMSRPLTDLLTKWSLSCWPMLTCG